MDFNRKNVRAILGIVTFGVALFVGLWHFDKVSGSLQVALGMITFFVIGLSIAFILNAPLKLIELHLFAPLNKRLGARWLRIRRAISVALTLVLLLGLILLIVFMVIPEMGRTFSLLADEIPGFLAEANKLITDLWAQYGNSIETLPLQPFDWAKLGETVVNWLRNGAGSLVAGTFTAATSLVSGVFSFVIGLIMAFYVLMSKERLSRQVRRILYAYLPEKRADRLCEVGRRANKTFGSFISGQFFEAIILGSMCFIGMKIFGFQFAPMVSVLVGVTSFIPIFGAFIACAVGVFMILVNQGLIKAASFLVFFLVMQQIEGNLIYPHVVGRSVMLPGMWVLVAATLGGNVAGLLGMVVSVPLASLLYSLLRDAVNRRNAKKEVPLEKLQ